MIFGHAPEPNPAQWKGHFLSRLEAIADGRKTYGRMRGFYVITGESVRAEEFVPSADELAEFLLDEMWIKAFAKVGDHADSLPEGHAVAPMAKAELRQLVVSWVQRRLTNGWRPTGLPSRVEAEAQLTLIETNPVEPCRSRRLVK